MNHSIRKLLLGGVAALATFPAFAGDVTPDRLVNADKEPHNWLMNHRTYDAQRYSPLDKINKDNVKNLKLAYAVAIGGTAANENLQSTPLAEDGFLYIVDQWGVVYKIDVRSGDMGRIVWRMDPGQEKLPLSNRGAALLGNLVVSTANYPARVIATDKDTGKVVWETNLHDQPDVQITAAPLAVKDKIIVGAAGGDRGVRDWIAALDGASGKLIWRKYVIPAPGEPGSETWKDKNNAWQIGGGAMWITGSYDPATNQVIWGTGNPVPMFDPTYRPGDNLYTNSMISWNPDSGSMNWYFQYTPGDHWDYDESHTHILIDGQVGGQQRKLITHSGRNGFLYTFERSNGQTLLAKPYVEQHQLDRRASIRRPASRWITIPTRTSRPTTASMNQTPADPTKTLCPSMSGGNNYWPAAYSPKTKLLYIPSNSSCNEVTLDTEALQQGRRLEGRDVPQHRARRNRPHRRRSVHRRRQEERPHPLSQLSAARSQPPAASFSPAITDGTFVAYDDASMEPLWKINVGTGFNAPPMTFEVNGKQYVAILSGLSPISQAPAFAHAGTARDA